MWDGSILRSLMPSGVALKSASSIRLLMAPRRFRKRRASFMVALNMACAGFVLLHARKTFFSFFCGRRVLPHLGQNCKTLGLPVRGGLAFLTVTLSLFRRLVRARGVGRAGSPSGESGPQREFLVFVSFSSDSQT